MIWLILIGGLINRYLNNGSFFKAFNLIEIVRLLSNLLGRNFFRLIVAVIIAQLFAISVFVDFHEGFTLFELGYSIMTFFLAPFLFIATKRLVGLQVSELLA